MVKLRRRSFRGQDADNVIPMRCTTDPHFIAAGLGELSGWMNGSTESRSVTGNCNFIINTGVCLKGEVHSVAGDRRGRVERHKFYNTYRLPVN